MRREAGAALWLLLAALAVLLGTRSPTEGALQAEGGGDVQRALRTVRDFARVPRPAGTAANAAARRWLVGELAALTPEVDVQEGTACDGFAGVTYCGHVHNVLARFAGFASTGSFALVAHYDSALGSPGAADDGAGVATLLEMGRRLAAAPHRNDVLLLFSDGEEDFLRGASLFSQHRWAADVKAAVNFEARGASGPSALFFQAGDDTEFLAPLGRAFNPAASSALVRLARALPNDSDATVLQRSGMASLAFAFADGLPHYHRASDTAANLSPASLAHHLDHAAVLVSHFSDAAGVHALSGPHVFFDVFGGTLVRYPAWLARLLALLLLLALVLLLRARRLTDVAGSLLRTLLALTGVAVFAILATVATLTARAQSRPVSFAVVLASLWVLFWLWPARDRDGGETGRAAGAALWAVPAVLLGVFAPEVSYLFQWPALALLASEVPLLPRAGRHALRSLAAAAAVVLWAWWAYTLVVAAGDVAAPGALAACFGATAVAAALGGEGRRVLAVAVGVCAAVSLSGRAREEPDPEGLLFDAGTPQLRRVRWNPQVDPWALRLQDVGRGGDAAPLLLPALDVESTWSSEGTQHLRLLARSRRGSSHLLLRELSGTEVRLLLVNGQPVGQIVRFSASVDRWMWQHATQDRDRFRLQFAGLPPEGFHLEMEVPLGAVPSFEVRDATSEWTAPSAEGPVAASFARTVVRATGPAPH